MLCSPDAFQVCRCVRGGTDTTSQSRAPHVIVPPRSALLTDLAIWPWTVIIADHYEPPLADIVDWDRLAVSVAERHLRSLGDILDAIGWQEVRLARARTVRRLRPLMPGSHSSRTCSTIC